MRKAMTPLQQRIKSVEASIAATAASPPADSATTSAGARGLTFSFGGPAHTLSVPPLGAPLSAPPAQSSTAAGVAVLVAHAAVRDANASNVSVSAYARLVHSPADGRPPHEVLHWLPHLTLASPSWRRWQLVVVNAALYLWIDETCLLSAIPLGTRR